MISLFFFQSFFLHFRVADGIVDEIVFGIVDFINTGDLLPSFDRVLANSMAIRPSLKNLCKKKRGKIIDNLFIVQVISDNIHWPVSMFDRRYPRTPHSLSRNQSSDGWH